MEKYQDMQVTAKGEQRAYVDLEKLSTLWFNTGTLCNLTCDNCYIESSPRNDRLVYLTLEDILPFLEEIDSSTAIGLTGGEPFLNPHIMPILETLLERGHEVLVLTNAYRAIEKHFEGLKRLAERFSDKLNIRVSLDHYTPEVHERERGEKTFQRTLDSAKWLYDNGLNLSIASRSLADEGPEQAKEGHRQLFEQLGLTLDLDQKLVIFPEMNGDRDLPEITTGCWDILNKSPSAQMCATERMVVKRKGEEAPVVMPCTLLAYQDRFIMGKSLSQASKRVYLAHKFCAEFCVLGGASCSSTL